MPKHLINPNYMPSSKTKTDGPQVIELHIDSACLMIYGRGEARQGQNIGIE